MARAIARVVVRALDAATRWVTYVLGTSPVAGREGISESELRDLVAANTVLDGEERRIIDEVIAAGASLVREVMVPRTEAVFLPARLTVEEATELVRSAWHSRYPVIDGTHDDVIGFVHLRDLLIRAHADKPGVEGAQAEKVDVPADKPGVTVGELAREVKRLPGSKHVLAALSEMRRERHHLAVVVDEYGGTAGIVTLEDLIEELVGEIHDEYDASPDPQPPAGAVPAEVDGRLNLADFAERTGFALPIGPYETVGGFLMAALGRLPAAGDEVQLAAAPDGGVRPDNGGRSDGGSRSDGGVRPVGVGWRLVVLTLDGRRVARVGLTPPPRPVAALAPAASATAAERPVTVPEQPSRPEPTFHPEPVLATEPAEY